MANVLVIIDMQRDFIDGSLGSPEAAAIVPAVVQKIHQRLSEGWDIAVTLDTHGDDYLETQEGRKLPVAHCIKDSPGWGLSPDVKDALVNIVYRCFEKPTFGSESLIAYLKDKQPEQVEFVGLCTDICVVSNAIGAKMVLLDAEVSVDAACCAGTSPDNHQAALKTMACCQISIVQGVL